MDAQDPRGFDHERLDVYAIGLDFIALTHDIVARFPRGRSILAEQLERAAMSVALNAAEGSRKFSRAEKVRFYRMSLRSVAESAAILDVAERLQVISPSHHSDGKLLLNRLAAMLLALIRRLEP